MFKRLPHLSGAVLSCVSVLALAGCGPQRDEFAPACPTPVFEQTLGDVARYRPGSDGRDLTDLVVQGRLVSVSGQCKLASKGGSNLLVAVRIGMQFTRGPAMQGNATDLPVFVAVTDGDSILDKQTFMVHVAFPSNVQMVPLDGGPIDMTLPITPSKTGAAYQIRLGFQLTPEELEANRRRLSNH